MYYIIYLSADTKWMDKPELDDLLSASVENNRRDGITGLLLYAGGNFIQLLEGDEAAVQQTFNRIGRDERHKGITQIASGHNEQRIFPEWAMGFKSIGADASPFKDLLAGANPGQNGQLPVNLLNAFIKSVKM